MLDALKFVQGAVGKNDLAPELTHFRIQGGRITGYNGRLVLSSPIACDLDCCPRAEPLIKAIKACEETAQLHMTPTGKLAIRSGSFRSHVDCLPEVFAGVDPAGVFIELDGKLLPVMRKLFDVTSEDASRPWAGGILFDGHSAFATNNVVAAEFWLGYFFPFRINVPRYAIKELLRIGEEPERMQIETHSATFYFESGRWLRTQLIDIGWPDIRALLDAMPATDSAVPSALFETLERISSFTAKDGRIVFKAGAIATANDDDGTTIECAGIPSGPIFNIEMLQVLEGIATTIGFEAYPSPCPFYGEGTRGAIVGLRT